MRLQRKPINNEATDMANLQALRDSFQIREEVHVEFRGYNGGAPKVRMGEIIGKEAAFATVKFDRGTQKIPYTRLMRCRPPADIEPAPAPQNDVRPPAALRSVPRAFAQLNAEPAPRPEPAPAPAPSPAPSPAPTMRVVESPKHQPDEVCSDRQSHEAIPALKRSDTPDDVTAWLDMGASLLPSLRATEKRLRDDARELAEQAEALMERSDAKVKEADGVAKYLKVLERLHE
jgi:hypothetical protein